MKKLVLLALVLTVAYTGLFSDTKASALDQGNLISDNVFANESSMTEAQINNFINAFPKSCLNPANYPSGLSSVTWQEPLSYFSYGNSTTPARVIWKSATIYHINPQVILSTLEKEQNLVTGSAGCGVWKYNSAMGYNCPDGSENALKSYPDLGITNTCVAQASNAGFARQVNHASWQLIFDMHRAYGDLDWGGDNSVYYYGRMTQGWRSRVQGGVSSYYDGYTSIDGQTIYLANGATASLYNYTPHFNNFRAIFTQWFGDTSGLAAYKTSASPTVYMNIFGYRMSVPSMAVLNDYGVSPDSIKTVDQSYLDSNPIAPVNTGISSEISHVVKSPLDTDEDGGSIYLISMGKRYQFQTMQQFYGFGFTEEDIRYLPLPYILNLPSGAALSNYITSPEGSAFSVSGNQKRLIFEYSTYINLNPSGSVSQLSYSLLDNIPSGNPIIDRPALVKRYGSSEILLYTGTNYYSLPSYSVYACWGFSKLTTVPFVVLASSTYTSNIVSSSDLSCINSYSGSTYVLNDGSRYVVDSQNIPSGVQATPNDITQVYNTLPLAGSMNNFVKSSSSSTVWKLVGNKKRSLPNYNTLVSFGVADANISVVPESVINTYQNDGIVLNNGQLVMVPGSSAVYVIGGSKRYTYPSSVVFSAYKNSWSSISNVYGSELDANYPLAGNVSSLLVNKQSGKVYLVGSNSVFTLSDSLLSNFGYSYSSLASQQIYESTIFSSSLEANAIPGTQYIKARDSNLVYYVSDGKKRPIASYAAMVQSNGGSSPTIMVAEQGIVDSIPLGTLLQ